MLKLKFPLLVFILALAFGAQGATVDTALTYSASMKKNIKAVVILPDSYKEGKTYPVVYLLHGAGGRYDNWIKGAPVLKSYADQFQLIVVCPDGNVTSWYVDSPVDPAWKYETYVATELVSYIDKNYKTIKDRKGRAISGLSMGGHGALSLAFKHQDTFGAAGSMSGGVDITPFPANWDIAKRLGPYTENAAVWKQNSVVNMVDKLTPKSLALTIDCGKDDFFYAVNMKLHDELMYHNIPHDFTIRPGGHTMEYWRNSVGYHMLFFSNFFLSK